MRAAGFITAWKFLLSLNSVAAEMEKALSSLSWMSRLANEVYCNLEHSDVNAFISPPPTPPKLLARQS